METVVPGHVQWRVFRIGEGVHLLQRLFGHHGASFDDSSATVYYPPGATGWGPMFYGRRTALWIRLSLGGLPPTTVSPLKVLSRSPASATVRVQRSANLRDWTDWHAVSRNQGPRDLHDPDASTTVGAARGPMRWTAWLRRTPPDWLRLTKRAPFASL